MTIEQRFDTIQNQLNTVCELLQLSITSLNTKKAVARFLNKSEKTIFPIDIYSDNLYNCYNLLFKGVTKCNHINSLTCHFI